MRLRESLAGSVPAPYLDLLTDRYNVIGDVAVLSLHLLLRAYEKESALTVVRNRKNIRTVLNRVSKLEGDHRVAHYEAVAGEETVTCHREYGFSYRLDVATVFFNPSLGTERQRVAGMVKPGERVLVPFAGVGPFVVPAATRGAQVVPLVRADGIVHFYTFKKPKEIAGLSGSFREMRLEIRSYRRCGNVAQGVSRWVFDLVRR
ncbi:hypothetical protein E2N92_03885 [Methanofollis formosanus]|uniref:SAM-dependent methyltransferase TRM5/TYW2-type domain-containing protein n=1 Tax=Methanofollis formosanus TaxID=299308 RepID=A0A8G1A0V3_9EURY|nr:hypothetical protein [Methanofollis formosanus]QYZ78623.1 hypothetical protein E2N92_03885 [Methanofollis formosanus]